MHQIFRGKRSRLLSLSVIYGLLALTLPIPPARSQSLNLNQLLQNTTQLVRVSDDLNDLLLHPSSGRVNVIVQLNGPLSLTLKTLILALGGEITDTFDSFDSIAVNLPVASLLQLVNLPGITYVSPDRPVVMMGHLSSTTGADAVRTPSMLTSGLDGSGIGIAVLDSGIYNSHKSFTGKLNNVRIVVNKDFTGEGRTDDSYGHGSHVASIAAGNGTVADDAYLGIAPNANLLNLRVLNSNGNATTSGLLRGLNWVMKNRSLYNIRIVHLSLGASAIES